MQINELAKQIVTNKTFTFEKSIFDKVKHGKYDPKATPEYVFGDIFCDSKQYKNFKVIATETKPVAYNWVGSHWEELNNTSWRSFLAKWLSNNYQTNTSKRTLYSLDEISKCVMQEFSKNELSENMTLIPFKNKWLDVDMKTGDFSVMQPTREKFVKYSIDVDINVEEGKTSYIPKSLPADSKLAKFLDTSVPNKEEQSLLQEYAGYTLLSSTKFHRALVLEGEGNNGKSVFLNIISAMHKKSHVSMSLDKLEGFKTYPLAHASLVICSEAPKKNINENFIKKAVTGDSIEVEKKFGDTFTIKPTAKWIIACNTFPIIDDKTDGVFRRLLIMKWNVQIKKEDVIRDLDNIIINTEMDLVMDWALEGLQRLIKRDDFLVPESMLRMTNEKRIESNSVLSYLSHQNIGISEKYQNKISIYSSYVDYCQSVGASACGHTEFWRRMNAKFKDSIKEIRKRLPDGTRPTFVNLGTLDLEDEPKKDVDNKIVDNSTKDIQPASNVVDGQSNSNTVIAIDKPTEIPKVAVKEVEETPEIIVETRKKPSFIPLSRKSKFLSNIPNTLEEAEEVIELHNKTIEEEQKLMDSLQWNAKAF